MKKKPTIAFMYDFDKTLCDQDMQDYDFIPNLGMTSDEFWSGVEQFRKKHYMEGILGYMYYMMYQCKEKGIPFTQEYLRSLGKTIKFYKGVQNWFKRINQYGESIGVKIEHYVISSGLKDIIDGSPIRDEFKKIFACQYYFDENGEAAMKYGISSIPNVLAFKGGKVVGSSLGFVPANVLLDFVEKYV